MKILVLSASPNIDATKSIVAAGEKRNHQMIVKHPSHLLMLISDSVNGYDRLYDGYEREDKPERMAQNTELFYKGAVTARQELECDT